MLHWSFECWWLVAAAIAYIVIAYTPTPTVVSAAVSPRASVCLSLQCTRAHEMIHATGTLLDVLVAHWALLRYRTETEGRLRALHPLRSASYQALPRHARSHLFLHAARSTHSYAPVQLACAASRRAESVFASASAVWRSTTWLVQCAIAHETWHMTSPLQRARLHSAFCAALCAPVLLCAVYSVIWALCSPLRALRVIRRSAHVVRSGSPRALVCSTQRYAAQRLLLWLLCISVVAVARALSSTRCSLHTCFSTILYIDSGTQAHYTAKTLSFRAPDSAHQFIGTRAPATQSNLPFLSISSLSPLARLHSITFSFLVDLTALAPALGSAPQVR